MQNKLLFDTQMKTALWSTITVRTLNYITTKSDYNNMKQRKYRVCNYKQLLDEVFVISGIIKVKVSVNSRSQKLKLITLIETLIISDITKTESNNCFIIDCFKANNDKRIIAPNTVYFRHAMFLLPCP